ncbi:MAG: hypothetical protein JKX80_02195 [Candidatus Pacebacteria bacterium]|nr:hypothetical protein [Candidatus Paceibacterota bacterium]
MSEENRKIEIQEKTDMKNGWWIVIILVVAFIGWQLFENGYFFTATGLNDPGVLYLSLAEPDERFSQAYTFDMATRELKKETAPIVIALSVFKDFSPDGNVQAFIGSTEKDMRTSSNFDEALQVYISKNGISESETGNFNQVPSINKITDVNTPFKLDLSVGNDGRVLFSARGDLFSSAQEPNGIFSPAKNWSIYIVAEGTEPKFVINGLHPKWIDDSKFLYMGEGGLFMFDMNKQRGVQFFRTPNEVLSNINIDLSDDTTTIVWNNRNDEDVTVMKVSDWNVEVPQLVFVGSIATQGFWVAISPDSSTLAVQAVDWETIDTNPNPRIEFYSLSTLEKVYKDYSLNEFDQNRMFMSDWK